MARSVRPVWLSTEQAAAEIGVSSEWVRRQIVDRRLVAVALETGRRRTYRVSRAQWDVFLARYRRRTDDPEWE